jgi:hypothetical protein
LDGLVRLGSGDVRALQRARKLAWSWLIQYPVRDRVWTQYFEDVLIYPDYRTNLNQYSPLETARYLLLNHSSDPEALNLAREIMDWVTGFFAADSITMGGIPEKGRQWGAEVVSEQVNDMDKMSSHTARFASVLALWSEVTGDREARERAFRSFNWATYSARENGLVKTSIDEGTGYWFSDGYGDYMRHFQRGMASVPEWAPPNEDHLLGSSSIVRRVRYSENGITYRTFDRRSQEVLRLRQAPMSLRAGNRKLPKLDSLGSAQDGYTAEPLAGGGFAVRVRHAVAREISLTW